MFYYNVLNRKKKLYKNLGSVAFVLANSLVLAIIQSNSIVYWRRISRRSIDIVWSHRHIDINVAFSLANVGHCGSLAKVFDSWDLNKRTLRIVSVNVSRRAARHGRVHPIARVNRASREFELRRLKHLIGVEPPFLLLFAVFRLLICISSLRIARFVWRWRWRRGRDYVSCRVGCVDCEVVVGEFFSVLRLFIIYSF